MQSARRLVHWFSRRLDVAVSKDRSPLGPRIGIVTPNLPTP